jgi:hypothetical protein
MKIVANVMEQIGGIELFPIISLLIFFTFFGLITYLVITAKPEYIEEMKNLPLDGNDDLQLQNNNDSVKQ